MIKKKKEVSHRDSDTQVCVTQHILAATFSSSAKHQEWI